MTELRDLIADRLIGDGTRAWGLRVTETFAMDPDVGLPPFGTLPWLSVRQVGTTIDLNRVPTEAYEVWIHADNTSFAVLDELERQVAGMLGGSVLVDLDATPPRSFLVGYAGTLLGDQVIPPWDAYARGLRFTTVADALGIQTPDDPRAAYLRLHIADLFCDPKPDCIQTDPLTWHPTDACPAIWIRPLTSPIEVQRYNAFTLFRETLGIQVLAETFAAQNAWVDRLALQLPGDILYVEPDKVDGGTGVPPRRSMMLMRVTGQDLTVDPLTNAQLRVEVIFSELSCNFPETFPPLRAATAMLPQKVAVSAPPPNPPDLLTRSPVRVPERSPMK